MDTLEGEDTLEGSRPEGSPVRGVSPDRGMDHDPAVELVSSATLHRGPIFWLQREHIRLPSGLEQDLEIVRHAGAVAIAALDAEGRMLLVRQYRHPAGTWLVEVPAGRVEPGEEELSAARRELEEETGHRAAHWSLLRRFWPAPGFCSERMTLFLAQGLEEAGSSRLEHDPDEELELLRLTPREALERAQDAKTLVAAAELLLAASR